MRLEGTLDLEPRRVRRWVSVVAIVVPVFLCMAMATWFIRAFIAPPMVAIPAYTTIAAVTPPEPEPPRHVPQPPSPPVQSDSSPASAAVTAFGEPTSPPMLPMFATFALAPPDASLRTAPPATVEPEPNVALLSPQADSPDPVPGASADFAPNPNAAPLQDPPDVTATATLEPSEPLAGPIPLPRRRLSAVTDGQVPLPRTRPAADTPSGDAEVQRRVFNAHAPD
jgi:hypothetical protein